MTIVEQLETMKPDWKRLVAGIIPRIYDDCRASDEPNDETPAISLTVGVTFETDSKDAEWGYQTGDNSFSGGAYGHPYWAVVTITRDSVPSEVADEIEEQIGEQLT